MALSRAQRKASPAKARTPEVLDPVNPDLALIEADEAPVKEFLRNAGVFFTKAGALETLAKATLARAKALKPPTTQDADEQIQVFIRTASTDVKVVEEHWGICQVVSQLHRKLTAGRTRATQPLEEAKTIAQRLHNTYAETERRRAAEEQERVRLAAEQRAREDRDRELARLEAEAVKAEEASGTLSEREQFFVDVMSAGGYDGNASVVAEKAGFKDGFKAAARLLSLPKIQQAIKAKQTARTIRDQAAAVKEAPMNVEVETITPNISRGGGGYDRTTHGAEILNERRFIDAVIAGEHGIPTDVLQVNPVKLNEYAKSLKQRIDLWPGVRYMKKTSTV